MLLRHSLLITLLFATASLWACSDDDAKVVPDSAPRDAAPQVLDTTATPDAPDSDLPSQDASARDASNSDASTVDVPWGVPACDPGCQAEGTHLCFKDQNGDCQECDTTSHCLANPTSLGPRCEQFGAKKFCVCDEDADCENNPNSLVCYRTLRVCACQKDEDCPPGKTCTGTAGAIPVCI